MESLAYRLTKELVSIDSTDPGNFENEIADRIVKIFKDKVKGTFLEKKIIIEKREVLKNRFNVLVIVPCLKEYEKEPALCFICHMDTVIAGEGWDKNHFPFKPVEEKYKKDIKLFGRGSCDMKSGLACAISALLYHIDCVNKNKKLPNRKIYFIGTVDEEDIMRGVESAIKWGWANEKDHYLDNEPTDNNIEVSHKGRTWFHIKVIGKTAHASMPEKGIDAIHGASVLIYILRNKFDLLPEHKELGKSTITFGEIKGGYSPYVVPDFCEFYIDMRLTPPTNTKVVTKMINDTIKTVKKFSSLKGIKFEIELTGDRPYIEKDDKSLLLKNLKNAIKLATNKKAKVYFFNGYTDTAVISGKLKNKNCMSYGPGSLSMAHKPNEYVLKSDIIRVENVLKKLVDIYSK